MRTDNDLSALKNVYRIFNIATQLLIAGCVLLVCLLTVRELPCPFRKQWRSSEALENVTSARIFCLITPNSYSSSHEALHSLRNWATKCQRLLVVNNKLHMEMETIVLSHEHQWQMLREAFQYVYDYHFADVDWLLKVDEHSFVVLDNLQHLLYNQSTAEPIYYGCKLRNIQNEPYMHGPTGYVLSKEALRRFVKEALPNATLCSQQHDSDKLDEEMGSCLRNVGVIAADSREADGAHTFMPFSPIDFFNGLSVEQRYWLEGNLFYNTTYQNLRLSKAVISFAHVSWDLKYTLNYLIHTLRMYGLNAQAGDTADIQIVTDNNGTTLN